MNIIIYVGLGLLLVAVAIVTAMMRRRASEDDLDELTDNAAPIIAADAATAGELHRRGNALLASGNFEAAIADFDRGIELNPEFVQLYYDRALANERKDDLDAAIADYTDALAIAPGAADAYARRAALYAEKGDYDAAIADYEHAMGFDRNRTAASTLAIGTMYAEKGDYEAAIAVFDGIIAVHPNPAGAYNGRGIVHLKRGDLQAAAADFDEAIDSDPDFALAYANLGIVLFRMGKIADAAECWGVTTRDLPDAPDYAFAGYAVALWKLGRESEATEPYRNAVEWDERWRDTIEALAAEVNWTEEMIALAQAIIAQL